MAQATSGISSIKAAVLEGVWIHDPSSPDATLSNFLYGNVGRSEGVTIDNSELRFIGRALPVYDMGGFESQELEIDITIPYGPDEQDQVEWFRAVARSRRALCYRDNRGRLTYGIIGSVNMKDEREGTVVSFTLHTSDYAEAI